MKRFSKILFFAIISPLVFAASAYAGPRPNYQPAAAKSLISISPADATLGTYPGNFPMPSPGGAATLKIYNTAMPAARLDSGFTSTYPYPTNKWYTSIFTNPSDNSSPSFLDYWGNRISPTPMTIVFDSGYPWSVFNSWGGGWGYSVGGQILTSEATQIKVNSIMAFSVQGAIGSGTDDVIKANTTTLKSYNDWSFTTVLQHNADATKRMTSVFGKGFLFNYNYFTAGASPRLRMKYVTGGSYTSYFYNNGGNMAAVTLGTSVVTDCIMIKNYIVDAVNTPAGLPTYQYFGIYAPAGSTFVISATGEFCDITLTGAAENDRYLSIALLKAPDANGNDDSGAFTIFKDYYQYAYNFISDTKVSWSYDQGQSQVTTNFNFTFDAKRTGAGFAVNQTVFALYPHQWKNMTGSPNKPYTYNSIRGLMKVSAGSSFSVKHDFNGIIPFLTYELPDDAARTKLQDYIAYDKNFNPANARIDGAGTGNSNTYYHGKALARAANLIPVFHQYGDTAARDAIMVKLKAELTAWYSGQSGKSFGYDTSWGGIIGSNPGNVNDFGASKFNDHHFHYGYFIYASAILAMYDPSFADSAQYKGIVDLLVKEIFNPYRNDPSFPFLRNFDVYEGHSYSDGRGGGERDFGNDEESSAEAMNAWAGIYLWGLATGNQDWINLAVYGYTTQYEATKNYYLNMDGDIWQRSVFNHISIGMLVDDSFRWGLWWDPQITQTVMGIQVMPLTQSMLYLGYNTTYAQNYYNEMWAGRDSSLGRDNFWKDVWLRFKALYDGAGALADWDSANLPANFPDTWDTTGLGDDGSSMSYSYFFIHFFNALGTVDTGYYADQPSFLVMNKNGARTFIAYNPDKTNAKTVHFYKRASSAGPAVPNNGTMTIPPGAMAETQDFANFKYSSTEVTAPDTVENYVYSIYSDNFLGGILGGNTYQDNLILDSWTNGPPTISFTAYTSTAAAFEGAGYMSATRTDPSWGGWAFRFYSGPKDMSAYYNGTLEVSLRINSPSNVAGGFDIGFETTSGGQIWVHISDLGFNQNSTAWQTVSIPLNSSFNKLITIDNLKSVTLPFIMRHNAGSSASEWGIPVYYDSILWKKANIASNFSGIIKNRSDGLPAAKITWDSSSFGQQNAVAQQYVEISLNSVNGNSWGIQIYTDNTSTYTVSDTPFTGSITSTTASGLVNYASPSTEMLPMKWRPAPSTISDSDVFLTTWQDPWEYFRDRHAFNSSTGLYSGCDEIKFMNRVGYKWDGVDYGALPDDRKIRIYFISDFSKAQKAVSYKSNIVIEYFNE